MARKCKCQICKIELTTDVAYKITDEKGKSKYYCNEDEYTKMIKEKEDKNKCMDILGEILHIPCVPPILIKEVDKIRKYYEYEVIYRTIRESENTIKWFISNNDDANEYAKARYIATVISNNINKVKKKYDIELKTMQELFKKVDTQVIDIDIMNNTSISNNKNISDISDFLD